MSFNVKLFGTFLIFGIFVTLFTIYSFSTLTKENSHDHRVLHKKSFVEIEKKENFSHEEYHNIMGDHLKQIDDQKMLFISLKILFASTLLAMILAYFFSKPVVKIADKLTKKNIQLDQEIANSTKQMESLLRLIDKYVIRSVTDTSGVIISVSEAFCKISQYTREELIGQQHSFVRHPDMSSKVFQELWETIQLGKTWEGKIKNFAKDGSYYWVDAHIEPNFEDGKIVSYTAIRNDITDKVLLEELNQSLNIKIAQEVAKSTEQLEQLQKEQLKSVKLSSIGALSAGITHEINTPLTYIKGNFEMILDDIHSLPKGLIRDRILEDSKIITEGLVRIGNIVEAMKEASHVSKEVAEDVNIYKTIVTALIISNNKAKQISPIYLNNKLFHIDNAKDEFEFIAKVQGQRIEQVWIVIISNALDELVKITQYDERKLEINIFKENNTIVVEFQDNAGGIDEQIIHNIFEPFVSMKESGGIGIGLNIAKKILDENNATIIATNKANGALFRIEFTA